MITVLKEVEVLGKAEFIPSALNLKELSDAALEMTAENADKLDKIKESIDLLMLSVAELQEVHDKDDVKGDGENV